MDYPVRRRHVRAFSIGAAGLVIALLAMHGEGRGQGRGNQPPPSVRASAPFDPTGYWSSLITQNWRLRMVPPAKGDYIGIPISAAGKKAADAWDQAKDEAAGIIDAANKRANQIVEEAKEKAREEAARIKTAAEAEVALETNRARETLRKQVGALVLAGATKVLEGSIDENAHQALVEKLAAGL